MGSSDLSVEETFKLHTYPKGRTGMSCLSIDSVTVSIGFSQKS
jgi:hypothetical protein